MRLLAFVLPLGITACAFPYLDGGSKESALEDVNGRESGVGYDDMEPVDQDGGCTLTQGYWKNHDGWPISQDTDLCGTSWLDTLETPPRGGDAFLILAHQYIAAKLNVAAGAADDVAATLSEAESLMSDCVISDGEHDRAIALAGALDDYNNGRTGPGHCDGGPPSSGGEGEGDGCTAEICGGEGEGEPTPEPVGEGEGDSAGEGEGDAPACDNPIFVEGVGEICP